MSFSERLRTELTEKHLLKHPFYRAWEAGQLNRDILRYYAEQYGGRAGHVNVFPLGVGAVYAQCDPANLKARKLLMENLVEEEGFMNEGDDDHPELWTRFAEGMGASRRDMETIELAPESAHLSETYLRHCRSSYAEGLAALYAYEYQNSDICRTKIQGLVDHYGVDPQDDRTLGFFTVHQGADIEHTQACEALLDELSPADQEKARRAALDHAGALWNFLTHMQHKFRIAAAA
jgi:pyrroloquinoline-quinone synthase